MSTKNLTRQQIQQLQQLVKQQSRKRRLTPTNYLSSLMKNVVQARAKGGKMSVKEAFKEVKENPPKVVKKTAKKYGKKRAEKQKIAIALSKAGKSRTKRT